MDIYVYGIHIHIIPNFQEKDTLLWERVHALGIIVRQNSLLQFWDTHPMKVVEAIFQRIIVVEQT